MPPQPGIFPLPHATTHKTRAANNADAGDLVYHHQPAAGPSKTHEEQRREKRKRELMSKLGKDMTDRMDIGRHYAEVISDLHSTAIQLSTRPETLPAYHLRLYPLSLERSALLAALVHQEGHSLDLVQTAYEEEREEVEEEWRKGRERVRERLLESIEERRRRAREEKDGEGAVTDAGLDSQSRAHNTRKLRNKLAGTSPPPTPLSSAGPGQGTNGILATSGTIASGPLLNPHSLSVDELPSPFPLSLTSTHPRHSSGHGNASGPGAAGNGRRRPKAPPREVQAPGAPTKAVLYLERVIPAEVDSDLNEIMRGNKRRRVATTSLLGKA
ncbi:hypothetical protein IEO21_01100 [Rhodonia placenta]|uniref:Uncharacterized protein n=2 Tax=Rhodonia placenta TaxID=104341 RepID=A0A1X6N6P2_9APHY|nr:hypothetical protein POSPLADRAFT_1179766 [Postia placenta MAD-698-R-SB12]KAF9820873.1 hypothetical protein IEO21_01100 [Postia placenta]OSX64152.1 hypothetical protein POSPLADRAFT_1179766 [Postia placenta MAD-698-R-SB12]